MNFYKVLEENIKLIEEINKLDKHNQVLRNHNEYLENHIKKYDIEMFNKFYIVLNLN